MAHAAFAPIPVRVMSTPEVSSDSDDETSSPARRPKPSTTITMTQGNLRCSTSSPTNQVSSGATRRPTVPSRAVASGRTSTSYSSHCSLLLSSMPDLQPLLAEAPWSHRALAFWPASTFTPSSTSARSGTQAINSLPSSLLGICNKEIDKIVADALNQYLSKQRPEMRATRVNVGGTYEDSSTIEFHDMGMPIAPWFAVTCSRCPGIYHNLEEALNALDPSNLGTLEFCKCEADVAVLFLRALKASHVGIIQHGKLYVIGPGMPLVNM